MWKVSALCVLAIAILAPPITQAQQVNPVNDPANELRVLGERAGQVVTLLEQLLEQRSTKIGLRRLQVAVLALQLRSNSIGDIETRVQTLQDRAGEAREYSTQLESELQRLDDVLAADR